MLPYQPPQNSYNQTTVFNSSLLATVVVVTVTVDLLMNCNAANLGMRL